MRNFAYGDHRMHMGIPPCKRAGIAKKFAYGDPIMHNEIVLIQGLTLIFRALIFLLHGRCHASELFVTIFGGVVAMKKGGKKYIIYVVCNSFVISNFYLEGVCKHK